MNPRAGIRLRPTGPAAAAWRDAAQRLALALGVLALAGGAFGAPAAFVPAPASAQTFREAERRTTTESAAHYFASGAPSAVIERALSVLSERYLEPVRMPDLALAGLQGLRIFDRTLSVDLAEGRIRLLAEDRVILATAAPGARDAEGWGVTVSGVMLAATENSIGVRPVPGDRLLRAFFEAMSDRLDPYSRYVPPLDAREEREYRRGMGGIGVRIELQGRVHVVAEVIPESPASFADIAVGDRLLAINGRPLGRLGEDAVHDLLRGPEDSRVTLSLRRGAQRSRTVALHRALVAPNTVDMQRIARLVVLRISAFNRMTQRRLTRLLVEAMADRAQPPQGFVIDLRGNRGGLLRQAVAVADVFLTDGPIMSTRGRHPDSSRDFEATSADLANGLPVVVLVDGRAASAAEIVAGALLDRRRAVVVGSTTLGKGLVQSVIRLPDDGDLILTWSQVVMPSGYPLQNLGVLPTVCTSLGAALIEAQLRALEQGRVLMAPALGSWRASRPGIGPAEVSALRNACPPAEGRDADMETARWLLERPAPYSAALSAEAEPGRSGGSPLLAAHPPR